MFATGGDYIGKGAYGCIFRPIIPCKSGKYLDSRHKDDAIKVGTADAGLDRETDISKILGKFPEASKYFVLSRDGTCAPPTDIGRHEPEWTRCRHYTAGRDKITTMIQLPYGGIPWESWREKRLNVETFDVHTFGQRILEAVALMTLGGVVHRDLHHGNYLIDSNGLPRIIDFGMSFIVKKETYKLDNLWPFSVSYNQIPPEMSLWDARWYTRPDKRMPLETAVMLTATKRYPLQVRRLLWKQSVGKDIEELGKYARSSELFLKGDIDEWWKYNWTKYDAWSCGTLLLNLLYELMRYPTFTRNNVYNEKKGVIMSVLYKLLHTSPLLRVDAVEALAEWAPDSIILKKYGAAWLAAKTPAP